MCTHFIVPPTCYKPSYENQQQTCVAHYNNEDCSLYPQFPSEDDCCCSTWGNNQKVTCPCSRTIPEPTCYKPFWDNNGYYAIRGCRKETGVTCDNADGYPTRQTCCDEGHMGYGCNDLTPLRSDCWVNDWISPRKCNLLVNNSKCYNPWGGYDNETACCEVGK